MVLQSGGDRSEMNESLVVPEELARTRGSMGPDEAEWVRRLPGIVADLRDRWSLRLAPGFPRLTYNYAAPAVRDGGREVVLKVCFPDKEFFTEAQALRLFGGEGAVELLEVDLERGALLLERLEPGTPLVTVANDEEATSVAAWVMRRLWREVPPGHQFPTVEDWARGFTRLRARFEGSSGPLPTTLVEHAEGLFAELLSSSTRAALLHGDLNYGNVLSAQREPWLAIDPKGVVGEPVYETGVLLRDPLPDLLERPRPDRVLARRVAQLAEELGFDPERIRSWGVAQAVLSSIWSLEDHGGGWEPAIACAELLTAIDVG